MAIIEQTFLKPGYYRVGGETREYDRAELGEYARNTRAMIGSGVSVPILPHHPAPGSEAGSPVTHLDPPDARDTLGWVLDVLQEPDGSVRHVLDVEDAAALEGIKSGRIKFTSPELAEGGYTDGLGREHGKVFRHVAFTAKPRNPIQGEFETSWDEEFERLHPRAKGGKFGSGGKGPRPAAPPPPSEAVAKRQIDRLIKAKDAAKLSALVDALEEQNLNELAEKASDAARKLKRPDTARNRANKRSAAESDRIAAEDERSREDSGPPVDRSSLKDSPSYTESEFRHAKRRVQEATTGAGQGIPYTAEAIIGRRIKGTKNPAKLAAFADALTDENYHNEAAQAAEKLNQLGYDHREGLGHPENQHDFKKYKQERSTTTSAGRPAKVAKRAKAQGRLFSLTDGSGGDTMESLTQFPQFSLDHYLGETMPNTRRSKVSRASKREGHATDVKFDDDDRLKKPYNGNDDDDLDDAAEAVADNDGGEEDVPPGDEAPSAEIPDEPTESLDLSAQQKIGERVLADLEKAGIAPPEGVDPVSDPVSFLAQLCSALRQRAMDEAKSEEDANDDDDPLNVTEEGNVAQFSDHPDPTVRALAEQVEAHTRVIRHNRRERGVAVMRSKIQGLRLPPRLKRELLAEAATVQFSEKGTPTQDVLAKGQQFAKHIPDHLAFDEEPVEAEHPDGTEYFQKSQSGNHASQETAVAIADEIHDMGYHGPKSVTMTSELAGTHPGQPGKPAGQKVRTGASGPLHATVTR